MTTTISAKAVFALRAQTGAGMMDCKKALTEAGGDAKKAMELLRQKGLKTADKKADRSTSEGRVYSYIHHNQRVGVMVQIACETDFVARGEDFAALCSDICMHIAATVPSPVGISADEVPAELIEEERRILLGSDDMANKPDEIKGKIVDGRIEKFIKERALLEQEFVKDPSLTVEGRLKATIAKLGENMRIEKFARFELGA
ncbi:MAG: translation elongation factor Ts [Planctomycetota bacterium]|nr:translation elongation factor Ts [Planctomycetota bacterium]MDA1114477.1 translation elongation factor Ts [Planctomycetota bacterium]